MQLFALVNGSETVHRISLSQALGPQVRALFVHQAGSFLQERTAHEFDPGHKPESDELQYIQPFDGSALLHAAQNPLGCPILDITDETLRTLRGLFVVATVDNVQTVCLQTFDMRRALTSGRLTLLRVGTGYQRLESAGLTLDSHVSALVRDGRLSFKSFHTASQLFDLAHHYHEATAEEIQDFGAHASLLNGDSAAFAAATESSRVRKQIALVLASQVLDKFTVSQIVKTARDEAPQVKVEVKGRGRHAKIVIPSDRGRLKDLLDLLLENCYRGCLSKTPFVANSKRQVKVA